MAVLLVIEVLMSCTQQKESSVSNESIKIQISALTSLLFDNTKKKKKVWLFHKREVKVTEVVQLLGQVQSLRTI